jgi:hypothetical protein
MYPRRTNSETASHQKPVITVIHGRCSPHCARLTFVTGWQVSPSGPSLTEETSLHNLTPRWLSFYAICAWALQGFFPSFFLAYSMRDTYSSNFIIIVLTTPMIVGVEHWSWNFIMCRFFHASLTLCRVMAMAGSCRPFNMEPRFRSQERSFVSVVDRMVLGQVPLELILVFTASVIPPAHFTHLWITLCKLSNWQCR